MKNPADRHTIAVDFDGVIHKYDSPWIAAHIIPDDPVDGAIEWLFTTIQKLDVVIFSTRCRTWRGKRAMRVWLRKHAGTIWNESMGCRDLEDIRFSYTKIPALVYLDDRAMRFEGKFPTVSEVHRARPWNKQQRGDN